MAKNRFANIEKDEISLQSEIQEIVRSEGVELVHVEAEARPLELIQLINEEADFFSHYNGQVIDENVGSTMSFDYPGDINVSIRHYYPSAPETKVSANELGGETSTDRLVPVSLMSKDLELDSVIIGRFVAGVTKQSARRDHLNDFCLQIIVMSVCGNGAFRENLTFSGRITNPAPVESSISSQDFKLVEMIFNVLEKGYGTTGLEFLTLEVMRNRHNLSEMTGYDVGLDTAFNAYIKVFGSYAGEVLKNYREQVFNTAQRLALN